MSVRRPTASIDIAATSSIIRKASCRYRRARRLRMRLIGCTVGGREVVGGGCAERTADDDREVREASVQLLADADDAWAHERPLRSAVSSGDGDRGCAIDSSLEAEVRPAEGALRLDQEDGLCGVPIIGAAGIRCVGEVAAVAGDLDAEVGVVCCRDRARNEETSDPRVLDKVASGVDVEIA